MRRLLLFLCLCVQASPLLAQSDQNTSRVIHVFVALADNRNQGIVPVAARLGNGDDPEHNLYWGSAYGVKTFFTRSADWRLVAAGERPKQGVLERCIFKHRQQDVYLVADAYRGREIQATITDFLDSAGGGSPQKISIKSADKKVELGIYGGADLLVYVGHDGLMDFQLASLPQQRDGRRREAIILACASKPYFTSALRGTGAYPLLWTTGLMAPEAYTLKSAVDGWIAHEDKGQIRERAAVAYDRYQKCGLKGARRLLVSGW